MRDFQLIVVGLIAVVVVIGLSASLISLPPEASEYLPSFSDNFYVSDVQTDNGNVSYSIVFKGVNFTFLYWYWPLFDIIDNETVYVAEQTVSVFVQVTFVDNASQVLQLDIDSPGGCLIGVDSTLRGVTTDHAHPCAGMATAETWVLHSNWVYIVSA
ncbi:MAG: hypothetical protein EAX87_15150 [Candidatus Thorarchaeota archaeon]|nr:hypothetical protein [Candidatus Thorarchaeota archaeon]